MPVGPTRALWRISRLRRGGSRGIPPEEVFPGGRRTEGGGYALWERRFPCCVRFPRRLGVVSAHITQPYQPSPKEGRRVGPHIVIFEACSAFTRGAARTLAPSPKCDLLHRRLQPFRHSMTAPVASGWSLRRVGLAPTGKRRLSRLSGTMAFPAIGLSFETRTSKVYQAGSLSHPTRPSMTASVAAVVTHLSAFAVRCLSI